MLSLWSFRDVSAYSDTEQQSPITERRNRERLWTILEHWLSTLWCLENTKKCCFSLFLRFKVALRWRNCAALKRRNWFHTTARGRMDVWPVQCDTLRCKNTPGLLTIRLLPLRYFSTSYKLRTETLALGIIIRCLRAVPGPDASSLHGPGKFTSYALSRFHVKDRLHTPLRSFSHTDANMWNALTQTQAGCDQHAESTPETPPPSACAQRPSEGGVSADSLKKKKKKEVCAVSEKLEKSICNFSVEIFQKNYRTRLCTF